MISRIFTLCIPFVGSLAVYWKPLPLVVLGTPTVLSGCLALLLPETSGKDLPQTIYEADQVIKGFQPGVYERVGGEGAIKFRGFSVGAGRGKYLSQKFAKLTWKSVICGNSTKNKQI
jgi:hypothetical protein